MDAEPNLTSSPPQLFALLIAIEDYSHPGVSTVPGADEDVKAIERWLRFTYDVPGQNIKRLLNRDATRAAIIRALYSLSNDPRIRRGDAILIYYGGHGERLRGSYGYTSRAFGLWTDDTVDDPKQSTRLLTPSDVDTDINGWRVEGIPDQTMGALLGLIRKKKGNNIVSGYPLPAITFLINARSDCDLRLVFRRSKYPHSRRTFFIHEERH
jgi:hypothetical protein